MRPVAVVVTVHRRYHELVAALTRLAELRSEFPSPPKVYVVWADPEPGRLFLFRRLESAGLMASLLTRPRLPGDGEGRATSVLESVNIRLGLERVLADLGPEALAVVQASDVLPKAKMAYAHLLGPEGLGGGAKAALLWWPGAGDLARAWHTSLFAVTMDTTYWPPLLRVGEADTLEWAWGKALDGKPHLATDHNSGHRRFTDFHLSEGLPPFDRFPEPASGGCSLFIRPPFTFREKLRLWAGCIFQRLKGVLP